MGAQCLLGFVRRSEKSRKSVVHTSSNHTFPTISGIPSRNLANLDRKKERRIETKQSSSKERNEEKTAGIFNMFS